LTANGKAGPMAIPGEAPTPLHRCIRLAPRSHTGGLNVAHMARGRRSSLEARISTKARRLPQAGPRDFDPGGAPCRESLVRKIFVAQRRSLATASAARSPRKTARMNRSTCYERSIGTAGQRITAPTRSRGRRQSAGRDALSARRFPSWNGERRGMA
jgi:hypothetical protein